MINTSNTLLCIFSFNMGQALANCLESTARHFPSFDCAIVDDQSDDPLTIAVLNDWRARVTYFHESTEPKAGKNHGNLYINIQRMTDLALAKGYRFLFMIQDDMQFVRPFSSALQAEYSALFHNDSVLQIDPRFHRKMMIVDVLPELNGYAFAEGDYRRSYADVGILDLHKIRDLGWRFVESEPANKKALTAMGMLRIFPFSPMMMHVPFPKIYRGGRLKRPWFLLRRGRYGFADMTDADMHRLDNRPLSQAPHFREFLRPSGMTFARLPYWLRKERRLFS